MFRYSGMPEGEVMSHHRFDVVAHALEVLDRHGLADLSMRRLAADLDVQPSALYWHFASREEVLLALLEERVDAPMREMVALLESAPPDRDMSVEAAREFARQLRDRREAVVGVRLSMRASVWTPCLIRSQDRRGPGIR